MRAKRCAHPECNKPRPQLAIQHNDPYCSAHCARAAHGVVFRPITQGRPKRNAA